MTKFTYIRPDAFSLARFGLLQMLFGPWTLIEIPTLIRDVVALIYHIESAGGQLARNQRGRYRWHRKANPV